MLTYTESKGSETIMPRNRRILYDNAIYHIVQRGHNKGKLFNREKDYRVFKDIIRTYKKRYDFDIYHYCIMSNHFHILIRVKKGEELPKIIQGITQSYSFYYRRTYDFTGYVYQNRYKSFLIEDDAYLLECGRYIERNPLRANIVKQSSQYHWSSYRFYTRNIQDDILTENLLYSSLGLTGEERRKAYQDYVSKPRPYENILDETMIG